MALRSATRAALLTAALATLATPAVHAEEDDVATAALRPVAPAAPAPPAPPAARLPQPASKVDAPAFDPPDSGPPKPPGYSFKAGPLDGVVSIAARFSLQELRNYDFDDTKAERQRTFDYTRVKPTLGFTWGDYRVLVEGMDSHELREYSLVPDPKARRNQDTLDFHQAFVQARHIGGTPFSAKLGRQELSLGSHRMVSATPGLNIPNRFDAARVSADGEGWRVDAFFARKLLTIDPGIDYGRPGQNAAGVWSTTRLTPWLSLDAYFLHLHDQTHSDPDPKRATRGEDGKPGPASCESPGARLFGSTLQKRLEYQAELLYQFGNRADDAIRAYGGDAFVSYRFDVPLQPRLRVEGNYASGDQNPKDNVYGSFNPIFGTFYEPYGLVDVVKWTNMRELATSVYVQPPVPGLNVGVEYHHFWVDSIHEDYTTLNARTLLKGVPVGQSVSSNLGDELDMRVRLVLFDQRLYIESIYGIFLPGRFAKTSTPGDWAQTVRVDCTVGL